MKGIACLFLSAIETELPEFNEGLNNVSSPDNNALGLDRSEIWPWAR